MNTMPHLDMVDREVNSNTSVSKNSRIWSEKSMISEFGMHSFLFSSSTLLRLSTHRLSIGPSNVIHLNVSSAFASMQLLNNNGINPFKYSLVNAS